MNNPPLTTTPDSSAARSQHDAAEYRALRHGATRWRVATSLADDFFDEEGLKLNAWLKDRSARIIKDGPHRSVYRLALPTGRFYLKHFKTPDLRSRLLNFIRPCRALLEWNAARRISELGIPTFHNIALGRTFTGPLVRDNYLITREIENVEPLDQFVRREGKQGIIPSAVRQSVAIELGRLIGRLHAGGLIHRDLHPGNILIRVGPDNQVRLWLIDLHAVSRRQSVSPRQAEQNLALLNNFFALQSTSADRLRCYAAYWQVLKANSDSSENENGERVRATLHLAARRAGESCARALQHAYRKGDRKWSRANRKLIVADSPPRQCRGVAEIGISQCTNFRDDPESLFAESVVRHWIERSETRRTALVEILLDNTPTICCATAISACDSEQNSSADGRLASVRQVWEAGHALLRRSLGTPRPLWYLVDAPEKKNGNQYLLTQTVPDAERLADLLQKTDCDTISTEGERAVYRCLNQLAKDLNWMHACGIDHNRLTADEIFVSLHQQNCKIHFWSLEAIVIHSRLPKQRLITALAILNLSVAAFHSVRLSHRARFLRSYLKNRFSHDWKSWWRDVAGASAGFAADETFNVAIFPHGQAPERIAA